MNQKSVNAIYLIKRAALIFIFLLPVISETGCSAYETIINLSRLKFKIDSIDNVELAGIPLKNKLSINDFSTLETLKLSTAFVRNALPLTFTINVDAKNPNDGTGGYSRTNATIVSFPWKLFLDDKQTVAGDISSEVNVPGTGETTKIPLKVTLDLVQFFKDRGYQGILNLAFNLAKESNTPSKITLYAQPTVGTPLGNIKYPKEIKIINLEYSK
jgi:hypothetical protein